jgi:Cell Wall Hydrolase
MQVLSGTLADGWLARATAPWFLATGLLISFTASAGHSPLGVMHATPRLIDDELITASLSPAMVPENWARTEASETPEGAHTRLIVFTPASGVDGDGSMTRVVPARLQGLAFINAPHLLPVSVFVPSADEAGFGPVTPDTLGGRRFDGSTMNVPTVGVAPLGAPGTTSPASLPALASLRPDGSTPAPGRAVALSSSTPAPIEPEIIAMPSGLSPAVAMLNAKPPSAAGDKSRPLGPNRPNYTDLIDPEDMSKEQRCLAEAIYFEARSEPPAGQAAVAQIVLNRVRSGLYPDSVCGVVYQNRHRYKACQFTFACEGRSLRINEPGPWAQATRIAREVTDGKTYLTKVADATHYHADYVNPYWAKRLKKRDTIGRHTFYTLKPGQR